MFDIQTTSLDGIFIIQPNVRRDSRGKFVKTVHKDWFESEGLEANFVEQYHTVSNKNVLRGLHFQSPPYDHYKLVTCLEGVVMDVVVDMRKGSPTYGHHTCFELTGEHSNSLYISKGFAHGFYVRSQKAILLYNVSSYHAPMHDGGVRWNSAGIVWPSAAPQISDRDRGLPSLKDFDTPF